MQVEAVAGRSGTGRSAANMYLTSWVAVAAFGLGYIGVAATRPDLLGAILPLAEPASDQTVAGRTSGDLADEIASLRKWVHDLQHELAATKSTLQEQVAHSSAIVQRLAAAEERMGGVRDVRDPAVRTPAPRIQGRALAPASPGADAAAKTAQATQLEPNSGANLKVINGGAVQIATGSVPDVTASAAGGTAATTPGFGPPRVAPATPPTGPRAIEIGSGESLEALRSKWSELTGRNGDVLGDLSPRYRLAADGRSAPFTLLAGPFETPADATRTCNALRAKGLACRVGAYGGNAF